MKRDKNNRRCIKFTGYLYLPGETGKEVTWNDLRQCSMKSSGRITIYDTDNKTVLGNGKAKPFINLSDMGRLIEKEKVVRIATRVKTEAQKKRKAKKA